MVTGRHFIQLDAWDLRLISNHSFMILGPGQSDSQTWAEDDKTEIIDRSQISGIWLAELETRLRFETGLLS
jgi:hypothetical protein